MSNVPGRVYVVDDDDSFRRSICRLLSAVGYEVTSFPSAREFIAQHSPHWRGCVLADLCMPEVNGLELQARLADSDNPLPVVFLSGNGNIPTTVKAMRQGAVDFLTKCAPEADLLRAIEHALQMDGSQQLRRAATARVRALYRGLSPREAQVFAGVVSGKLNKQIASDLGIALRTVKLHRTHISRKLGMASVAEWVQLWNALERRPG